MSPWSSARGLSLQIGEHQTARLRLCRTASQGEQSPRVIANDAKALLALQTYEGQEQPNPCMPTDVSLSTAMPWPNCIPDSLLHPQF